MKQKILDYIEQWQQQGYSDGIPDAAPPKLEALNKAPSYRQICRAIMRNDRALTTLGFAREKTGAYMMLKRIEIEGRNK